MHSRSTFAQCRLLLCFKNVFKRNVLFFLGGGVLFWGEIYYQNNVVCTLLTHFIKVSMCYRPKLLLEFVTISWYFYYRLTKFPPYTSSIYLRNVTKYESLISKNRKAIYEYLTLSAQSVSFIEVFTKCFEKKVTCMSFFIFILY